MPETLTLTKSDLQDLIASAIAAAKAPNVIEQAKLDADAKRIKQEQEARLKVAQDVRTGLDAKKRQQRVCSHQHGDAAKGSHLVYVQEQTGPGYLICQKNQCIIRPGVAPKDYKGTTIYDTAEFNRLIQTLPSRGEIFG